MWKCIFQIYVKVYLLFLGLSRGVEMKFSFCSSYLNSEERMTGPMRHVILSSASREAVRPSLARNSIFYIAAKSFY